MANIMFMLCACAGIARIRGHTSPLFGVAGVMLYFILTVPAALLLPDSSQYVHGIIADVATLTCISVVVFLLPSRNPRTGPKTSSMPYLLLGTLSLISACLVGVAGLMVSLNGPGATPIMIIACLLLTGAFGSFRLHRRQVLPSASVILERDTRPPVLFLRSFQGDAVRVRSWFWNFLFAADPGLFSKSFQELLSTALNRLGPFIALGNPNDYLPDFGASKIYPGDDKWNDQVLELLDRAGAIILAEGGTPGLRWELQQVRKRCNPRRVFLVTPPRRFRRHSWTDFGKILAEAEILTPDKDPGCGAVIGFDEAFRPAIVCRNANKGAVYAQAIEDWRAGHYASANKDFRVPCQSSIKSDSPSTLIEIPGQVSIKSESASTVVEAFTKPKRRVVGLGALLVVSALAYLPAAQGDFIWLDRYRVSQNQVLRDDNGLQTIWANPRAIAEDSPFSYSLLWLEYQLWGPAQVGYHIVNMACHAFGVVLLWVLLRRLDVPGDWLAAAIYALHPLQVSSVAWISGQRILLSGAFYWAALVLYSRLLVSEQTLSRARSQIVYALAFVLFLCALLSDVAACTFPVAVLFMYWWKRIAVTSSELLKLCPFAAVGIGFVLLCVRSDLPSLKVLGSFVMAGRVLCFYVTKLIWPFPLSFVHRCDIASTFGVLDVCSLMMIVAVVILWLGRRLWGTGPVLAVLFSVLTLCAGLVRQRSNLGHYSVVSDHVQYIAAAGLIAFGVAIAATAFQRYLPSDRTLPFIVGIISLGTFACLTFTDCYSYRNAATLWEKALRTSEGCSLAYSELASNFFEHREYEQAIHHWRMALELDPGEAWRVSQHVLAYKPKSTRDWMSLLDSQDAAVRRTALLIEGINPESPSRPVGYYDPAGPLGQLLQAVPYKQRGRMAVIGLGFGAVGAYVSACGKCVFFETDLAVVTGYAAHGLSNLSERDSTRAQFNIVVGDPLVKLQENSECYEAMILDAFNCDPVLERLLTDEGLKVLESHLSEGGVLIFNISTEPVRLGTLLRELAAHAGLTVLYCNDVQLNDADLQSGKVPSNWAAMSRYPATLDQLVKDPRWTKDGSSWLDMMKPRN